MNLQIKNVNETDILQIAALIHEFAEFENLSEFCKVSENDLRGAIFV